MFIKNVALVNIVAPKSDSLSPLDLKSMSPICSKCNFEMEQRRVNKLDTVTVIDSLFSIVRK